MKLLRLSFGFSCKWLKAKVIRTWDFLACNPIGIRVAVTLGAGTIAVGAAVILAAFTATMVAAQPRVPSGFTVETIASGLGSTSSMAFAPDGRLFVAERSGRLLILRGSGQQPGTFLTVSAEADAERGLLGFAFDPEFSNNGFVYIYYTQRGTLRNRLSRFRADTTNPGIAAGNQETVLLDVGSSAQGYHNGGALHFGRDGMLYLGVGDGHTSSNAQDLSNLQGKILRLNVRAGGLVPGNNPFAGQAGRRGEIWAYGFRNPFTFAVDPANGALFINDVGQDRSEEINRGVAGGNFGWPACEGACTNGSINPVASYNHGSEGVCAITGGVFYRGGGFPAEFSGNYFFGDYCGGWIKRLTNNGIQEFGEDFQAIDLDVGPDGALYALSANGVIYRVNSSQNAAPPPSPTQNQPPQIRVSASTLSGMAPLAIQFSAARSFDPDGESIQFTWNFGDGSPAQSGVAVSHTFTNPGTYTVSILAQDARGATSTAGFRVTASAANPGSANGGNTPPNTGSTGSSSTGVVLPPAVVNASCSALVRVTSSVYTATVGIIGQINDLRQELGADPSQINALINRARSSIAVINELVSLLRTKSCLRRRSIAELRSLVARCDVQVARGADRRAIRTLRLIRKKIRNS